MGCCSSKSLTAKSPTLNTSIPNETVCKKENIISQQNMEKVNTQQLKQLKQHHDINQGQYESSSSSSEEEDELPKSFANNKSIVNEVMRLEQPNTENKCNIETKSDENSDDNELISNNNNESFAEFPSHTTNSIDTNCSNDIEINNNIQVEDSYHPFGFIIAKTENEIIEKCEKRDSNGEFRETVMVNLEELYAENLKQHGFDANKFRMANGFDASVEEQFNNNLSSFGSSTLSSKSNINNFITQVDQDDDLILEELSRSFTSDKIINTNDTNSYIQNFKALVKTTHKINNIMDDQDEELMDAILSLDLAD